ncbi:MAG: P27 family phage terminase small subunit [Alteromonadaceae bacterium]|nr:P27 family phage terminase small subunit [Alteromonadaceae bacterium]
MKGPKPNLTNVIPMKPDQGEIMLPPDPPDYMTPEGMDAFIELAPELTRLGRLEKRYIHQFAAYCEAVGGFMRATRDRAIEGDFYKSTGGRNGTQQKRTAAVGLQIDHIKLMNSLSALFGLSPVDEQRLRTDGQGDLFDQIKKAMSGAED